MIRVLGLFFSLTIFLQADVILVKSLACKDVEKLKTVPDDILKDSIKLNIYAMSNACTILSKSDKIQAHEYEQHKKSDPFTKIYLKKSGRILFIRSKNISVEQPGKRLLNYSR